MAKKKPEIGVGLGGVSGNTGTVATGPGNSSLSVGASFNPANGDVGVKPNLTIGNSPGAQAGGSLGGTAGGLVGTLATGGSPVGAAIGSLGGSALGSTLGGLTSSSISKERKRREALRKQWGDLGIFDENGQFLLPDGSTFRFGNEDENHSWKNPSKAVKDGNRRLYGYETDYTADTDYISGMAGISLSRLLNGGRGKPVDQLGNEIGNQLLGSVGYGADFNQKNFSTVMNNARSVYAASGIQSKDEYLALANEAYGQGRLNDADYAVAQQTASMVFDNDYNLATTLMANRWDGLGTASKQKTSEGGKQAPQGRQNRPGRIYSPVVSPEEAMLSVQPFFDYYERNRPRSPVPSQSIPNLAQGAAIAAGAAGLYGTINRATGGALGNALREGVTSAWDTITGSGAPDIFESVYNNDEIISSDNLQLPEFDATDVDVPAGDFELPSFDSVVDDFMNMF
jgi:hypothetical protein